MTTVEQATRALDSLDDFARMDMGVDAIGPRRVLRQFIAERDVLPQCVPDMLAVLCGDGGQFLHEHGLEAACRKAVDNFYAKAAQ